MLLAGHPEGAADLTQFDAACIALAFLGERYSGTEFTLNHKGLDELWRNFEIGGSRASITEGLAELKAAEAEGREAAVSGEVADLDEFRKAMGASRTPSDDTN